jgi:hypothetical protein
MWSPSASSSSSSPVLFNSPFSPFETSSDGLISSPTQLSLSRHPADAIRRFSEPAHGANSQRLAAHITSARAAYAEAFASIKRSSRNAGVGELLESSTARDVADTALELARSEPSETSFVSKLVGTLHHYHSVFDVLSQADFSYLTLIWGGMKLILIVSLMARHCRSDLDRRGEC